MGPGGEGMLVNGPDTEAGRRQQRAHGGLQWVGALGMLSGLVTARGV